ncbi:nuclear factor related to kappa-B-binding protein [Trichonephila clavipes]|nr:nuclear factor related to kappa-B-binding protein [Trichonephila clavipes]
MKGSPKACYTSNRINYSLHAIPTPNQAEVKCTVLGIDGQSKKIEIINSDPLEPSSSNTHMADNVLSSVASNISAQARDICNSRQSTVAPTLTFPCAKNIFGNLNATQIVSVTPVQIKPCPADQIRTIGNLSSHIHDILNVDMKPSSPSFVGQPPVLQPILTHQNVENANSHSTITTSVTPTLISTIAPSVTKTKVNCTNLSGLSTLSGFQTIVIKQDPGIRTCNGVSAIPVLSIEERPPSTNSSAINTAPVVARLLNGSQYLSFSNIVPSSNSCSSSKPIAGTVQNFRVQGGNLCPQVLSTSTIKVVHSAPVSAITDSRIPVISLKNQLSNVKEPPVIAQSPASLNVCGKVYQMANVRNTVISKDVEPNLSDVALPKEFTEIILKDGKGQDHGNRSRCWMKRSNCDVDLSSLDAGGHDRRMGPTCCTTACDDRRIVHITVMDRSATSRIMAQQIQSVTYHSVSTHTIRGHLQQSGMSARCSLLCLPLTGNHMCLRRQWC